ncbi:MAG: hypothetical protein ACP5U2_05930 [Bryobacteraceae bacterium]
MAGRKVFPLRLDPEIYEAIQRWADDELRSKNAQIDYLLRDALRRAGRLPRGFRKRRTGGDDERSAER